MTSQRRAHAHGFTLIEVMFVVVIIAVLSAIAYPSYVSQINKGRRAECRGALFQAMQQQERYFTQYVKYAKYNAGAATAVTRSFSGDTLAGSACTIAAVNCTAPGNASETLCIELQANFVLPNENISYLYMDSDGRKGCQIGGSRVGNDVNKNCWP